MFYIPQFLCIPLLAKATSKSLQFYIYAYVDLVAGICRLLLFSNIVLVMVYSFMIRTRTNKWMSWNRFSCTLGYSKGLKWSLTKQLRALSFVSSFYYFVDVSPSPCELIWWWETFSSNFRNIDDWSSTTPVDQKAKAPMRRDDTITQKKNG